MAQFIELTTRISIAPDGSRQTMRHLVNESHIVRVTDGNPVLVYLNTGTNPPMIMAPEEPYHDICSALLI